MCMDKTSSTYLPISHHFLSYTTRDHVNKLLSAHLIESELELESPHFSYTSGPAASTRLS